LDTVKEPKIVVSMSKAKGNAMTPLGVHRARHGRQRFAGFTVTMTSLPLPWKIGST
jgi:hypothetical protein